MRVRHLSNHMNASALHQHCTTRDSRLLKALTPVYGTSQSLIVERISLLARVTETYLNAYDDGPVRVFRCPGRINLRGMHVDTHGGYLNLMTHQREVLVVASPSTNGTFRFQNIDPQFEPFAWDGVAWRSNAAFTLPWHKFITNPAVQKKVLGRRGHWGNYVEGAIARVQHRWNDTPLIGIRAAVGSDLPRGAALSSSTALTLAIVQAIAATNGLSANAETMIRLGQEAEWYTGARSGLSDQAAMVLGRRDAVVAMAIHPDRLDTDSAEYYAFPKDLVVLVVDSHTTRSLSGAHMVEYTRNRFAYSLAMEVLRQEMRAMGNCAESAAEFLYLSDLNASRLAEFGGPGFIYGCLKRIDESIPIDTLQERYELPQLQSEYDRYFGTAPEELRPSTVNLRGPLLFGIAESERARCFPDLLKGKAFEEAGRLMSTGHDGDRVVDRFGRPYSYDVGNTNLDRLAEQSTPIVNCPGSYRASSPALDSIVDAALEAGALGASLTGGGIAGAVLVLCRELDADRVSGRIASWIATARYQQVATFEGLIDTDLATASIVRNQGVAGVGEISFD